MDDQVTVDHRQHPAQPSTPDSILVAGDATVDWMLAVPTVIAPVALQASYQWESRAAVRIAAQPGGSALVLAVLTACAALEPAGSLQVTGTAVPESALADPATENLPRTFTIWQPYPIGAQRRDLTWRMHQFLGVRPAEDGAAVQPSDAAASCLVIDDANLGFRDDPPAWPHCLIDDAAAPGNVILKMSGPLGAGQLWDLLVERFADRLTLYISVGDLRKEFAPIGQPLSWERTASDVTRAVRERSDLALAQRVIVSLGLSGALLIERDGPSRLIFDPLHQEGDWEGARPGTPTGLGTCIAAALALAASRSDDPDWPAAVCSGLAAGRALHEGRLVGPERPDDDGLGFPAAMVARILRDGADSCYRTVAVPENPDWHIFASAIAESHRELAERIVIEGDLAACRDLPVERIGAWSSIGRTEIESMRSVRNIIREFLQERRSRPLSLAVFGPPGSGKSFAIKQMAREWMQGGTQIAVLEFNLSQFADSADLPAALQRVRDCAVEGMLPLVFWDEFDSSLAGRELGWLAQFLAPMQDGAFIEGGIVRPIGPAIFIFAGGTHATMASFKARAVEIPGAKATDFLSRLRGYVDILGPNPRNADDRTFVLRRALLLRALLQLRAPGLLRGGRLDIDPGVLQAFLDVTTYVHGARSMESIVDMSTLSGRLRYERSALPPRHQLGLHVDPDQFLTLVDARNWQPHPVRP
ncbi:MAG TPA: AAA family ATPase [Thermomicrobiales bacterium]|nr:AAA family ATPase [Thermomicrobiales bacterium]